MGKNPVKYESCPGFYILFHRPTKSIYIGSTGNVSARLKAHRNRLASGTHSNQKLQSSYTTWSDFNVQVTYVGSLEEAKDWEQRLMDVYSHWEGFCNVYATYTVKPKVDKGSMSLQHRATIARSKFKRVSIDGVVYDSCTDAAKALGVTYGAISSGIRRPTKKHANWFYVDNT